MNISGRKPGKERTAVAKIQVMAEEGRPFPLGARTEGDRVHIAFASGEEGEACLHLYRRGQEEEALALVFPEGNRLGDIRYMTVSGIRPDRYEYSLSVGGKEIADGYAALSAGRDKWGVPGRRDRYRFPAEEFDWGEDARPGIPLSDTVIYRLHVRGFTKHPSSGVKHKGTFAGVLEKIPYLKELGVTMAELMVPTDFYEAPPEKGQEESGTGSGQAPAAGPAKVNYWGYGPSLCFAPKASFGERGRDAGVQFKELVKAFHENGLEVAVELYFEPGQGTAFQLDCLRHWVYEYHVDGIHGAGAFDSRAALEDPVLSGVKLFSGDMDGGKRAASYRDDFQNDMRKFLKGDEDCLRSVAYQMRTGGKVNFMANTNGFTMMDMVSYDRKHNEDNGEKGKDGPNYNYSWNCGAEGPVKKRKIMELRRRQLRNAWVFLTVAQGIPLILAGDEFGNSQYGNNNAYCQDNPVGWVEWKKGRIPGEIQEFARYMLSFRRAHPMLRKGGKLREADYLGAGCPDFSVHGEAPWFPQYDSYRRQLAFLYCGKFAGEEEDSDLYVMFNMHWEPHAFALPHTEGAWRIAVDTAREASNGICGQLLSPEQKELSLEPRSAVILVSER